MRDVELEWFQLKIQGRLLRSRGTAFQDLFSNVMEAAYPGDFERVRPYGNKGDKKCDGLLHSSGVIFQVYAPREMKEGPLLTKIADDFAGAKKAWKGFMRGWTFVHNDPDGLTADGTKLIEKLRRSNPSIVIETWGYERIETVCLGAPRASLVALCGRPPSRQDFEQLTFAPIARVLQAIRGEDPDPLDTIEPVSPTKLQANSLDETVAGYLRLGRQRERLVQQYFEKHPNPTFGDEVAAAFRGEYVRLKKDGLNPTEIFASLQEFAGGSTRGDVEHEAAVLAVMSYLFERCDIFEPPAEVSAP